MVAGNGYVCVLLCGACRLPQAATQSLETLYQRGCSVAIPSHQHCSHAYVYSSCQTPSHDSDIACQLDRHTHMLLLLSNQHLLLQECFLQQHFLQERKCGLNTSADNLKGCYVGQMLVMRRRHTDEEEAGGTQSGASAGSLSRSLREAAAGGS